MRSRTGAGGGQTPATRTTPGPTRAHRRHRSRRPDAGGETLPSAPSQGPSHGPVSEATSTFTPGPIVEERDTFFT